MSGTSVVASTTTHTGKRDADDGSGSNRLPLPGSNELRPLSRYRPQSRVGTRDGARVLEATGVDVRLNKGHSNAIRCGA